MRIYKLIIPALVLVFASCVEDKGNYDYTDIPQVEISGIDAKIIATQFNTLKIEPGVKLLNGASYDDFEYTWVAYRAGTERYKVDTVSNSRILNDPIYLTLGDHYLRFLVRQKNTESVFSHTSTLTVINEYSLGLMVYSNVEGYADLTFINSEGIVAKNMYYALYGEHIGRNPTAILYHAGGLSRSSAPVVMAMCDDDEADGGLILDPEEFMKVSTIAQAFAFRPAKMSPANVHISPILSYDYLFNDGDIHSRDIMSSNTDYPYFGNRISGDYYAAPFSFTYIMNSVCFYDQLNRKFRKMETMGGTVLLEYADMPDAVFNPNAVGLEMIAGRLVDITGFMAFMPETGIAVMKDDQGKKRLLQFTVGAGVISPTYNHDLSAHEGTTGTELFTIRNGGDLLFYGFGNKIGVVNIPNNTLLRVNDVLPSSEQITCIRCDERNEYTTLFVATGDGSNNPDSGSVYVLRTYTDGRVEILESYRNICGNVVDMMYKEPQVSDYF